MSDQHLVIGLLYLAAALFFALWRYEVHRRKVIIHQMMGRIDKIHKIALRVIEAEEREPKDA